MMSLKDVKVDTIFAVISAKNNNKRGRLLGHESNIRVVDEKPLKNSSIFSLFPYSWHIDMLQ